MRPQLIWVKCAVGAAALFAVAAASWAVMPQNSFLESPVGSVTELQSQVKKNVRVRDRYRRHFAMSDWDLRDFFATLRLTRLQRAQSFDVYNVPDSGLLRAKRRLLKAGTWVFVDRAGTPVLMRICGNPLMRGPKKPFSAPVVPDVARLDSLPVTMPTTFTETKEELVARAMEPDPMPDLAPLAKQEVGPIGPIVVHAGLHGEVGTVAPFELAFLPWLMIPSVGIPSFGGGGPHPPQPGVPEPGSLLVLCWASLGYLGHMRRRAATIHGPRRGQKRVARG